MTEPAPPKRLLTTRLAIVGVMLLVLLLAVAGLVFEWLGENPAEPVKVRFVRFENSENGKSVFALLAFTNVSNQGIDLVTDKTAELALPILNEVRWRSPSGQLRGDPTPHGSLLSSVTLKAKAGTTQRVLLPQDGRTGRVVVLLLPQTPPESAISRLLKSIRGVVSKPSLNLEWVTCEQEIQCPRRLPDGTIEPPRLGVKEGPKR